MWIQFFAGSNPVAHPDPPKVNGILAMDSKELLEEWLVDRPQVIKDLARTHPPDGRYRLSSGADDDLYLIYSYSEDGTITAVRHIEQMFPMWKVFGMKPEDLIRVDEHGEEMGKK